MFEYMSVRLMTRKLCKCTELMVPSVKNQGVVGGFDVSDWYPEKSNQMLLTVTDQTSQKDIDRLVQSLSMWVEEVKA